MRANYPTRRKSAKREDNRGRSKNPRQDLMEEFWSLTPNEKKQRFPDTREASLKYGPATRTLNEWVKRGHIQAIAIGKNLRIDAKSLQEYLKLLQGKDSRCERRPVPWLNQESSARVEFEN